MSNTAINNQQNVIDQALTEARSSQGSQSKQTILDPSLSLTSASAIHLGNALQGVMDPTNPVILNMISSQRQREDAQQQRFLQIIDTLATQVELLSDPAKGTTGLGDPNGLAQLLSQKYLTEEGQGRAFSDAYSAQLGPASDLSLFSMVAQEARKLDGDDDQQSGSLGEEETEDSTDSDTKPQSKLLTDVKTGKQGSLDPDAASGRDAIFAAAGKMQQLVGDAEDNMIQQLQRQIQMMEAQITAMENIEKFMIEEGKYLTNYLNDPSYQNLEKLIEFLKSHFTSQPDIEKMLDAIEQAGQILDALFGSKLWAQIANQVPIKELGGQTINQYLTGLMGQVCGNTDLFSQFMRYGEKNFMNQIQQLIQNLANLILIYDVLTGKGTSAIFDMESLLMNLEQVAIQNNAKQSEQRKDMADEVRKGLDAAMQKLIDAQHQIAKAEHESHHHGIFGAIFDFFKSIFDKIADIVKSVANVVKGVVAAMHGDMSAASADFDKAKNEAYSFVKGLVTFVENIVNACKDIVNGIKDGNFKEVLKGVTLLATDALLCLALGPLGPMLADSQFGKDMQNLTKIVVDAVGALGQVIVAGFEKLAGAFGDKKADELGNKNLEDCKKLGEDILTNPQFQTFMDIVAVVMIVAAAASQQYWLAGIMLVMLVANDFGGTQWVTDKIAEGIEGFLKFCGVKDTDKLKEWSKVAADIILIAAVMATGSFSGAFEAGVETGLKEATSTGVDMLEEDGIEMVEMGASKATTETTETIGNTVKEQSESAVKKAFNKLLDAGKAFLRNNGAALTTLGTTLGSTSLGLDIAKAAEKKGDHTLEEILEIIQMVIAVAFSLAGGVGMGLQDNVNQFTNKINGIVSKISSSLSDYLENNLASLTKLSGMIQGGGMLIDGAASAGKGGMQLMVADLIKKIAEYQNDLTLFEATNKDNNAGIQQNNQRLKEIMKEFEQIVKNFDAPSLAGQGVENALLQNA